MNLFSGFVYNLRGLSFGIKRPKLLGLGLIRFLVIITMTVICASLVFVHRHDIVNLLWIKPERQWLLWLWFVFLWIFSLFLFGISTVLSYLVAQILFSVIIMDAMSRVTERMITGQVSQPHKAPLPKQLIHLVKQEIPRTTFPVFLTFMLMVFGWLTPLGPFLTVLLTALSVVFLAWDNTDIIPTRLLIPFKKRLQFMLKTFPFHLGFGLWFLIPGLNIIFLSFAPVGATLYYIDMQKRKKSK